VNKNFLLITCQSFSAFLVLPTVPVYNKISTMDASHLVDTSRFKYRFIFVTSLTAKKDRMIFVSTVSLKGKHPKIERLCRIVSLNGKHQLQSNVKKIIDYD